MNNRDKNRQNMFEGEGHHIPRGDHQQLGEAPPERIHGSVCSHCVFAILH